MSALSTRSTAVVTVVGVVVALAVSSAPAASATTVNGRRCTIVGTSGADRLVGTNGNDVICGLGGNDTLTGFGGDDVLDGGPGNDTLTGSGGADTLVGGPGVDTASYADHASAVVADLDGVRDDGSANERDLVATDVENLTGGSAADRLTGSASANTIVGGAGADQLSGGAGNDRLSGGVGDDTLDGAAGADVLEGGRGDDALKGGAGNDVLAGQPGDDTVVGDGGSDSLNGGGGENFCDTDPQDRLVLACMSDSVAPAIESITVVGDANIDTGHSDVAVTVRATDDLSGVAYVVMLAQGPGSGGSSYSWAWLRTSSGTAHASTWRGRFSLTQDAPAGEWTVQSLTVVDLGGNAASYDTRGELVNAQLLPEGGRTSFMVVNSRDPDVTAPVIGEVQVSAASVDVTGRPATVHVSARVTDDRSGVSRVWCGSWGPRPSMSRFHTWLSETAPGLWEGDVTLPADLAHGTLNLYVDAEDGARNSGTQPGYADVQIVSENEDVDAPELIAVDVVTPVVTKAVSTDATVSVTIADQHLGRADYANASLCRPDGQQVSISGSSREVWRSADGTQMTLAITVPLPEAAPRGQYTVCWVSLADTAWNTHSWVSSPMGAQLGSSWMWTVSALLDDAPTILVR